MTKCEHPEGIQIMPGGICELDPCIYEDIEMHRNVTVIVSRCRNCGHIEISWIRQEDTEDIALDG